MLRMPEFEVHLPRTVSEAMVLRTSLPDAMFVAGGTDLLPNLRRGVAAPALLVDLGALDGLRTIESSPTHWRLGAGVTLAALASDAALAASLPAIVQAAASVAGPGHRSAATLGGNLCQDTRCVFYNQSAWWREANGWCLKRGGSVCHVAPQGQRCHAAFEGDMAPAAIACDAQAEVVGPRGMRRIALGTLYRDDGAAHLALERGELIVALHLPRPAPGTESAYRKQRARGAMDFPLAGVAMRLRRDGDRLAELAVAIGGTNSNPFLLEGTAALLGRPIDDAMAAELGKLVSKQVSPMRSTVTAAHHRRRVAAVAAQRLLRELGSR